MPDTPSPVKAALVAEGMPGVEVELISPLGSRKGRRLAYCATGPGGRKIKLRHFEDAESAAQFQELSGALSADFQRVTSRYGAVSVEEWILGQAPTDAQADALAGPAGEALARLHVSPVPGIGPTCPTEPWVEDAHRDANLLEAEGRLDAGLAGMVRATLSDRDPGTAAAGLIHRDFCRENLIVDEYGRMRVIDNEWLMPGPVGWDIGRTFHLWPMAPERWAEFLEAYAPAGGLRGQLPFWILTAALMGARVCHQRDPERLSPVLAVIEDHAC